MFFMDNFMFSIFPIFFFIVFALVIGMFIWGILTKAKEWNQNNQQPVLSVAAQVVVKRTSVSGGGKTMAHTHYFVTFQVESQDRMEFELSGQAYGMLAEGDVGKLTFQGTRFLDFQRK